MLTRKWIAAAVAVCAATGAIDGGGLIACKATAGESTASPKDMPKVVSTNAPITLLRTTEWTEHPLTESSTPWRYYEAWQTDVCRMDSGELIRVDPCRYWLGLKAKVSADENKEFDLVPAQRVVGSPFPSKGWEQPDFDDGCWQRQSGPLRSL